MAISLKPLKNQVLVITGASSGIGLATARAAAKKGARLVLAARNGEALADIVQELNMQGGQAIHVVADVGRREDVQRIADAALDRFGGFDTWVNNAGISIFGRLEDVSVEDYHRLFDTNFWSVVYGSLIAASYLRNQGGAIINLGSVLSDAAIPIQGMYSASKHAVKGFTDALRMELEHDGAPVSVTLIKPTSINTPYTEHAANYTGHDVTLPPPVYAPEEVANAILHAAAHPKRDVMVGSSAKVMSSLNKYAEGAMDWMAENVMYDQQLRDQTARHSEGSLYRPARDGQVHGDYQGHVMKTSLYTRATLNPLITGAVVAAAGAATYALLKSNGRKKQEHHEQWQNRASQREREQWQNRARQIERDQLKNGNSHY
ncbi:MAG: SDR family oxidoreductase [Hymenobacteraceae bacterium]|nr:SDR family oxidoreductase [Hymenobacteraceae bacterium]MDX5480064.1 SDR family oxidoreductase [Hymenobacteraceae bacterium]